MLYALNRAEGFVMISGRPGTGKTTLINNLVDEVPETQFVISSITSTQMEADDLLLMVAYSFGIDIKMTNKAVVLQSIHMRLKRYQDEGRRALLIIDEAQDLSISGLEELRLLTNLQEANQPLLQIFIVGQEGLLDLIRQPKMEQVHQRIVAACHLEALKIQEVKVYVEHRLKCAGWLGNPSLDDNIYPIVFQFSDGIPRLINLILSRLFLHGCVEERHSLSAKDAMTAFEELKDEHLTPRECNTDISSFNILDKDITLKSEVHLNDTFGSFVHELGNEKEDDGHTAQLNIEDQCIAKPEGRDDLAVFSEPPNKSPTKDHHLTSPRERSEKATKRMRNSVHRAKDLAYKRHAQDDFWRIQDNVSGVEREKRIASNEQKKQSNARNQPYRQRAEKRFIRYMILGVIGVFLFTLALLLEPSTLINNGVYKFISTSRQYVVDILSISAYSSDNVPDFLLDNTLSTSMETDVPNERNAKAVELDKGSASTVVLQHSKTENSQTIADEPLSSELELPETQQFESNMVIDSSTID